MSMTAQPPIVIHTDDLAMFDSLVAAETCLSGTRVVSTRAVGSALLSKGLEAYVAVVLDAFAMDARHLYVAMTRGARRLVVCARSAELCPS